MLEYEDIFLIKERLFMYERMLNKSSELDLREMIKYCGVTERLF